MEKENLKTKDKKASVKRIAGIIGKVFLYIFSVVLSIAVAVLVTLLSAIYIISKSDSEVVKETFVTSMIETGALDFCAHLFLSDEEVNAIMDRTRIVVPEGTTDKTLIVVGTAEKDPEREKEIEEKDKEIGIVYDEQGICIIDIKGKTYEGKVLFVKDPSRVRVTGLPKYGEGIVGKTTEQMAREADALAAVNAGGYREESNYKTGGIPLGNDEGGFVMIDGEILWGGETAKYEIIGIDYDNILHVDRMSGAEAKSIGIKDAVNYGPILVKNGEPCVVPTTGSNLGFHPRTAIGQRADGSIIIVVIDGRQAHSMGASYTDLIEIFMRYEAVNAANLDGGMSSYMYYDGKVITKPYMLYFDGGKRTVSTSIIITKAENAD